MFLAYLLPVIALCSLLQIILSWNLFAFHQTFSNDHPQKGETVYYRLHAINDGILPICAGYGRFSNPAENSRHWKKIDFPFMPGKSMKYEQEIRCSYRGIYVIGLNSLSFIGMLGILETELTIEPRLFYVYPQLVDIDSSIEQIACSSGITRPDAQKSHDDITIFEYLVPIRGDVPLRRIAWKRWAATGIPSAIINGQSRSPGMRIILDLWPGTQLRGIATDKAGTEKLASEDMAVTAVFSAMRYLAEHDIPVEFVTGGSEKGVVVDSKEGFQTVFEQSVNIIFNDENFPYPAFSSETAAILVTTRPLDALFSVYEDALNRGTEPHLLLCPPPVSCDDEKKKIETLAERQIIAGSKSLLRLADARSGTEELVNVLHW
jgi:hypothetical protein